MPSSSKETSTVDNREIIRIKVKCHDELLDVCRNIAVERRVTMSSVMNLSAIKNMSETLPVTKEEFLNIQYVTKANFEKFGKDFLAVTQKYKKECEKTKPKETNVELTSFNDIESFNCTPKIQFPKTKSRTKRKRKTKWNQSKKKKKA